MCVERLRILSGQWRGEWEMYPVRTMGWLRKVCSSVVNMLEKENNGDREHWEPRVATVLST